MSCEDIRSRLAEYAVGFLEEQENTEIERHLRECASCRQELQSLQRTGVILNSLTLEEAPGDLWDAIRSRIETETPQARRSLWDLLRFQGFPRLAYAGLIAAVLVGIALLLTLSRPLGMQDDEAGNFIERHEMLAWNDPLSDKAALGAVVGASVMSAETEMR